MTLIKDFASINFRAVATIISIVLIMPFFYLMINLFESETIKKINHSVEIPIVITFCISIVYFCLSILRMAMIHILQEKKEKPINNLLSNLSFWQTYNLFNVLLLSLYIFIGIFTEFSLLKTLIIIYTLEVTTSTIITIIYIKRT